MSFHSRRLLCSVICLCVCLCPLSAIGEITPRSTWEQYYETPGDYSSYTNTATESGLNGTLLKIEGTLVSKDHGDFKLYNWTVAQSDGKPWIVLIPSDYAGVEIGSTLTCYGVYLGAATNAGNTPVVLVNRLDVSMIVLEKKKQPRFEKYEGLSLEERQKEASKFIGK